MRAYAITAQRHRVNGQWKSSEQVPTFYLLACVQGITGEKHAETIALDLLGGDCSVCAVEVDLLREH
jgi:hypothetical protein